MRGEKCFVPGAKQPEDERLPEGDCRLVRDSETADDTRCSIHGRDERVFSQRGEYGECGEDSRACQYQDDAALRQTAGPVHHAGYEKGGKKLFKGVRMMERGIITISEARAVTMPAVPVWMTQFEIADLFGAFSCDVRKAIHAIYKNEELSMSNTMKYIRQPDGISYDVYNLEMVMAVSFRIRNKESRIFRQYLTRRLYPGRNDDTRPRVYFIVHREVSNRKGRDKGDIYN